MNGTFFRGRSWPALPARVTSALLFSAAFIACTEPRAVATSNAPAPALEARIDVSGSPLRAGAIVTVNLQLAGTNRDRVGSFTFRVTYDTTGLRFIDELPINDGATRVTNPTPGLIRVAGASVRGFATGILSSYRFQIHDPAAIRSLRLSIDELHERTGVDVSKTVVVAPFAAARLP